MSVRARSRLRPLLGWLTMALPLLALLAHGAGAQDGSEEIEREAPVTAPFVIGSDVYASRCASCHGASGQGGTTRSGVEAPSLREVPAALVDLVLRTGRMPPGDLDGQTRTSRPVTDAQREGVLVWMRTQGWVVGDLPEIVLEGADPARGQEVYAANCQQCHGSTGGGGVAGGGAFTPVLVDRDPIVLVEAIRMGPFQMPRFGQEVIGDQEMADLVAFLHEVRGEPGTPVGLVELNPVFASAFVFVLALVVLISTMWLSGRVAMFPDPGPGGAAEGESNGGRQP